MSELVLREQFCGCCGGFAGYQTIPKQAHVEPGEVSVGGMYTHAHTHTLACTCTHTHTLECTHTHTHTHSHSHTHTTTLPQAEHLAVRVWPALLGSHTATRDL